MDKDRFDGLTRTLAAGTSRRTLLHRLAGGMLGGVVAGIGLRQAAAQPQPMVGICHLDDDGVYHCIEVNGNAVPAHEAHGDAIAPDFASDPAHCGGCGIACPPGYTCVDGACVEPAPTGVVVAGELNDTDPKLPWQCFLGHRYDAYTFEHPGGDLSLAVRGISSGGGSIIDPVVLLYAGTGIPDNSCDYVAEDDDGGCEFDAYLETTVAAGTYTAVVVELRDRLGTYTFERNTFSGGEGVCP